MQLKDLNVICISLKKRPDRWARLSKEAEVAGLPVTRVDAVDASTFVAHQHPDITLATAHNIYFKTRRSNYEIDAAGAVGCSLSHFAAWKALIASDKAATLVFEDDATIPVTLVPRLEKVLADAPPDWDIIQLQKTRTATNDACKPIKGSSWELCTSLMGTHAYIVSRRGAKRLLEKAYPIELHVDAYMAYMARLEHIRMIWHPLIDIQPRMSLSDIDHGNSRICSLPTDMDDRGLLALPITTIAGIMALALVTGGLVGYGLRKLK